MGEFTITKQDLDNQLKKDVTSLSKIVGPIYASYNKGDLKVTEALELATSHAKSKEDLYLIAQGMFVASLPQHLASIVFMYLKM